MPKPMSDVRLAEIRVQQPGSDWMWDEKDAIRAFKAVDELLAEVERLRSGLCALAEMPDGQEVVSAEDLRVSGDGSHVVSGPAFIAIHEEDLAVRIKGLLT